VTREQAVAALDLAGELLAESRACDGTQDYVCTLDSGKKVCTPPYGWVSTTPPPPPPPPPACNPNDEQACYDTGGSWDPWACNCTSQCVPTESCAEFDYTNCVCRVYYSQ